MSQYTFPLAFGAVFTAALVMVLLLGCTASINPDLSRLGDAGDTVSRDGGFVPLGDGGSCPPGFVACGPRCVDPSADDANCGGCGRACGASSMCVSGRCACAPGDPACAVVGDPDRCGGARCADAEYCVGDRCVCRPGLTSVGGQCVDLLRDPANCGAPGQVCDQVCAGGACHGRCPPGLDECDGSCVRLDTDPLHCGRCGRTCDRDELCVAGNCRGYRGAAGCDDCRGDFAQCCDYGGGVVCADADACP